MAGVTCSVAGCDVEIHARGLCYRHYRRVLRHGSVNGNPRQLVTHCNHGHEYTPDNTYYRKDDGRRMCRECMRRRSREKRERAQQSDRAWYEAQGTRPYRHYGD